MTSSRAGLWIGVVVLFAVLVGLLAWLRLSHDPRYEGDPAVIARNEEEAVRRLAALAREGVAGDERSAAGYVLRAFAPDGVPRAYAWPVEYGVTGIRTFAADADGRVAWTNAERYSGPGRGPAPEAAFASGRARLERVQTGADGALWRLLAN